MGCQRLNDQNMAHDVLDVLVHERINFNGIIVHEPIFRHESRLIDSCTKTSSAIQNQYINSRYSACSSVFLKLV